MMTSGASLRLAHVANSCRASTSRITVELVCAYTWLKDSRVEINLALISPNSGAEYLMAGWRDPTLRLLSWDQRDLGSVALAPVLLQCVLLSRGACHAGRHQQWHLRWKEILEKYDSKTPPSEQKVRQFMEEFNAHIQGPLRGSLACGQRYA